MKVHLAPSVLSSQAKGPPSVEREKVLTPLAKSVQHYMLDSRSFLPLPGSEMVSCKLLKPSFFYLQTRRTNTCLKCFCEDERQLYVKSTHIVWPRGMIVP